MRTLSLPIKAVQALATRGPRYVWHKALRRSLRGDSVLKRRLLYGDPRAYWTLRGGDEYRREQEGQPARTARLDWVAGRIASYRPSTVLEVGCGYGKPLRLLGSKLGEGVRLVGVDFSPTQLAEAGRHLGGDPRVGLALGSGARLPFPDKSFDLVYTSAVILHNPPPVAEAIRREILRVASKFVAHSEDTDETYNRYGYDSAAWYRGRGIALRECGPIPVDPAGVASQFCVAEVPG